ncbi:adenosylmethionine-8-amino-7-oxononanoate transaminase [Candidatus Nitrososphaera gargensis Ga9.2]|uniref:Adenosylmethionine-8-amino-7-oxononanoate aminotransferase n=1 Tax=Nitrososphaera gargensis (strain Ga9.2) TaxID=1237085 RepID=K0IIB2_NITGG|nr:adenosylmethionine--8-amino-7-oxononanoate transaminase [Candidatus Nitrososphaera gargensis]AFU58688.1 adenosylmethionine-8-amino-7-oxononanoate transaminase [Candidatus Nitrososphaera gargensis Ga9.2]
MNLRDADKKFVWHPYTQMSDWKKWNNRVIVKGEGFYLVDSEGTRYLDGIASMWCNVWGHGQNKVVEAMTEQLKNLQHSTLFGLANGPSAQLAEELVVRAKGMDRVFYTDNGSTAIEAAMKMALQYWRNKGRNAKKGFISLEHGYHGDTIGTMSVGYIEKFFGAYKPLLTRVHRAPSPLLYGSRFENEKDLVDWCLEKTEKLLKKRGDRTAALVMESGAQIAGGAIIYPDGYQRKVARLCRDYDVLLVLDEIATGFGRLGSMIEYLAQRSKPDIVCFGKALTAGYFPLAVTLTTDRIFDAFLGKYSENKHFYHGHTFTGHPVGCAAALANIELYEKQNLMQQINENGKYIASRLREFVRSPIVADIRHKGLLAGIELARNNKPIVTLKNKERINYFIMQESLKMGVHLRPLGNIMMVIPPLAIGRKDLEKLLDVQLEVLRKVEKLS